MLSVPVAMVAWFVVVPLLLGQAFTPTTEAQGGVCFPRTAVAPYAAWYGGFYCAPGYTLVYHYYQPGGRENSNWYECVSEQCANPKPPGPEVVWTEYCTGEGNTNPTVDWQWWRYSNEVSPRYERVRAGDGTCTPPPPAEIVWTQYCTRDLQSDPTRNWQWWRVSNETPARHEFVRAGDGLCAPPTSVTLNPPRLLSATCEVDPANPTTGRVELRWEEVSGATGYDLRVRWDDASTRDAPVGERCPNGKYSTQERWCFNNQPGNGGSFVLTGLPLSTEKRYVWWLHSRTGNNTSVQTHSTLDTSFKCLPDDTINPDDSDPLPVAPVVTMGARSWLVQAGTPAQLYWSVVATYPVRCELTGGTTRRTFSYLAGGGTVSVDAPFVTDPVVGTTRFGLVCQPDPSIDGVASGNAVTVIDVTATVDPL